MRRSGIYFRLILVMLIAYSNSRGQETQPAQGNHNEKVWLFADRSFYVAGETLDFYSGLQNFSYPGGPFSKVLYVELITPNGFRIAGGKFSLANSIAEGSLWIPSSAISGTYYIKAYTRSMRNEGPGSYHFTAVRIINPDTKEVLPATEADTSLNILFEPESIRKTMDTEIIPDKPSYSSREKISLGIKNYTDSGDPIKASVLSVARWGALAVPDKIVPDVTKEPEPVLYYAENDGLTLTGKLMDKISGRPLPNARVNLSIIGERDFMSVMTDSAGHFYFNLPPQAGQRDIFLSSGKIDKTSPEILVDNDFCTWSLTLPSPPFRLNPEERSLAEDLIMNSRIDGLFDDSISSEINHQDPDAPSFYGHPTEVIQLDKYIELPTIEEYFNELPTRVKVRTSQNTKFFRFSSSQPEMSIYEPLVLIDWVAVDDIGKILGISPRDIERIELVDAPYIKGQMTYGGIINFISKDLDFAGIDLPESGTFINYSFFQENKREVRDNPALTNLPDTRNTVFWETGLLTGLQKGTSVTFTAPDTPGKYLVVFRVILGDGTERTTFTEFEVK